MDPSYFDLSYVLHDNLKCALGEVKTRIYVEQNPMASHQLDALSARPDPCGRRTGPVFGF